MNEQDFKKVRAATSAGVAMMVAMAVSTRNPMIASAAVLVGMALLYTAKKRVRGILEDEMTTRLRERAAAATFQIFTFSSGIIAFVLVTFETTPGLEQTGNVMAFSACAIMIIYSLLVSYYSRKGIGKK